MIRLIYMGQKLLSYNNRFAVRSVILFFILIAPVSCSSQLKFQRETPLSELNFYYGENFRFGASYVKNNTLGTIKRHLKTSVADRNPENPAGIWRDISEYSISDGIYILFELSPETRLPAAFLDFQFELDGVKPLRVDRYYTYDISGTADGPRIYASGFYSHGAGPVYQGVGLYYPIFNETADIAITGEHQYRFLILFPGESSGGIKHEFKVIFHNGRTVRFRDE